MQSVFDALQRRHGFARGVAQDRHVGGAEFHDVRSVVELPGDFGQRQPQGFAVQPRPRGGQQPEQNPRDGRVDAGAIHGQPNAGADECVQAHRANPEPIHQDDDSEAPGGEREHHEIEVIGVGHGDNQHRAHVVGDGEREQEDLQTERHARAECGHHADDEGDVGGHRHAPTAFGRPGVVEGEVDRGGDDHAADRRDHRECRFLDRTEFPRDDLPFDLEADDEKEDRHQQVVHPEMQRFVPFPSSDADPQMHLPEVVIRRRPRRVRQRECKGGAGQQHRAAGRLNAEETPDRRREPADRRRAPKTPGTVGRYWIRPHHELCTELWWINDSQVRRQISTTGTVDSSGCTS